MEKETPDQTNEPIETPKNTWLYPTDDLGKLEKDMVFESKTYQSGIIETEIKGFTIRKARTTKLKK
jgi:hypothetical protein